MATPSLAMIPSAYADSKVYSVLPNNGDGDFTFNRDSSATRVGQNGLIQTVGYFGSELVTNGDFATDSDWNKNAGWTISGGTANCDGTANNAIAQNFSLPTGTLRIKFDITARTQGAVNLWINKPAFTQLLSVDAVGSYEVDVVTTSGANNIYFYSASNFSGSIDNVSVQQILGDQPRLNYDISNGVVQSCPSLLLEPASTNLITYSEAFDNSYWSKTAASVTSGFISPDGTNNAFKLVEDTSNGTHRLLNSANSLSGDILISIFAKKGERNWFKLSNNNVIGAYFDLQSGSVGTVDSGVTANIENYGNGWYRCSILKNRATSGSERLVLDLSVDGSGTSYLGDGTSGIYIYGAQLEIKSYPTSYIPTAGSSQTRAAETCDGAGNAATFNSTEQVLYVEASTLLNGADVRITLSDGTITNRVSIEWDILSNTIKGFMSNNGNITTTLYNQTDTLKIALLSKPNNFKMFINGSSVGVDTTATGVTGLDRLEFSNYDSGKIFYGNCKDIRVYNEALTDAQLQTLTTL